MTIKLDIQNILQRAGYGSRAELGQIIQWAASQRFSDAESLLKGVARQFGKPSSQPSMKMRDIPAPFNTFLPGKLKVTLNGEIATAFQEKMPLYKSADDFYFMKQQTETALAQLVTALRLPVAVRGAAMPDLHLGYSLPIGGVVALDNAISPAFVGYDIACRLCLTLFDPAEFDPALLDNESERNHFLKVMLASSSFGLGAERAQPVDHPVMHNPFWKSIKSMAEHKLLAQRQLGTQGAGNHFCDLVTVEVMVANPALPPVGTRMVGLMTHSGSRGVGNKLAHFYAALAEKETASHGYRVEKGYGFLLMDTDAGREYWHVMNLMGEYAQANHEIVHAEFAAIAGLTSSILTQFENHHNFAWLEQGKVIHRKGATPAGLGEIGIIPGTSGTSSYLVKGLGNPASLFSASHGAGRPFSRTAARAHYNDKAFREHMKAAGVTYFGVAPDETFMAYKDIDSVMEAQGELATPIARITPRVVVMGGGLRSDDGD